MHKNILAGKNALVTGASSGLGADFARQLAQRGANLILVARREHALRQLADELTTQHSVKTWILPMNLAAAGAPESLFSQTQALGIDVDVLVNNAGFGIYGDFVEIPWERERQMLEIDLIVVLHLTKLYVREMLKRNDGYVLQVASIGAYQPSPTYASYSAAKGFILLFGEALDYELRRTNVSCTVVSPGITATEFLQVSGQQPSLYQRLIVMDSSDVARIGIDSMLKRRPSVVPGWLNALTVWGNRLVTRRFSAAVANILMNVR